MRPVWVWCCIALCSRLLSVAIAIIDRISVERKINQEEAVCFKWQSSQWSSLSSSLPSTASTHLLVIKKERIEINLPLPLKPLKAIISINRQKNIEARLLSLANTVSLGATFPFIGFAKNCKKKTRAWNRCEQMQSAQVMHGNWRQVRFKQKKWAIAHQINVPLTTNRIKPWNAIS